MKTIYGIIAILGFLLMAAFPICIYAGSWVIFAGGFVGVAMLVVGLVKSGAVQFY